MEASINERHLKDFVRLLQCASRFGDDLCMHANKDLWELAVTNSSKSAFCLYKLRPRFFSRYKALGSPVAQRKGVKCQLLVKSVLAVIGKASSASSIERLDLKIHDPDQGLRPKKRRSDVNSQRNESSNTGEEEYEEDDVHTLGSMLILRLVCKHGVTKKHSLHLGATEFLRVDVDPDSTPSSFTISAKTLRDWLDHFSLTTSSAPNPNNAVRQENQLGWLFGKNEVRLKSWEGSNKDVCTEIKVDTAEFGVGADGEDRYWLEGDRVDLTLPMKEFRATLQLADSLGIDLTIAFSEPTQPLTMTYIGNEDEDFDIFCAIATTTCDAFSSVEIPKSQHHGNGSRGILKSERGRSRNPSEAVHNGEGEKEKERDGPEDAESSRKRQRSETPNRKKNTKLSFSENQNQNQAAPSSVVRGSIIQNSQNRVGETQHYNDDDAEAGEGLFLPGGSQEDLPPLSSQRLTQQQIMEMSGMGEMHMEDLVNDLDALDEEEYNESQRERPDKDRDSEEGDEDEETEETDLFGDEGPSRVPGTRIGGEENGGDGVFEPDQSIFDPPPQITDGLNESSKKLDDQSRDEDEMMDDDDDDGQLESTQKATQPGSGKRNYTSFFGD